MSMRYLTMLVESAFTINYLLSTKTICKRAQIWLAKHTWKLLLYSPWNFAKVRWQASPLRCCVSGTWPPSACTLCWCTPPTTPARRATSPTRRTRRSSTPGTQVRCQLRGLLQISICWLLVCRRRRGCFNGGIAGERGAVNRFISYKTLLCAPHVSGCETFLMQCAKSVALFIYYDLLLSKVNITSTATHNKSRKLLFVELLLHFLDA